MIELFRESKTLEKILLDNADEALYFYSLEGKLIYVSPAFEKITGFTPQELHEKNFIPFIHPDDYEWTMALWTGLYNGEVFEDAEYRIIKKNGDIRWSMSSWKIVLDQNGNQIGIQGKQQDITKRKLVEEELETAKINAEELAFTDELTSLYNRRAFFMRGSLVFKQALRFGHSLSVIMMDIDYFKKINDKYGHSAGDNAIREVALLTQNIIREVDIVARIGGDEFAFILPETELDDARNLVERLRQAIAMMRIKVDQENSIQITCSFGVFSSRVNNESLDTMLTKADKAMYEVKYSGRNKVGALC